MIYFHYNYSCLQLISTKIKQEYDREYFCYFKPLKIWNKEKTMRSSISVYKEFGVGLEILEVL